jgi:hypothetical protein
MTTFILALLTMNPANANTPEEAFQANAVETAQTEVETAQTEVAANKAKPVAAPQQNLPARWTNPAQAPNAAPERTATAKPANEEIAAASEEAMAE